MGMPVLILGASGSGKSTSLRNFEPTEVGVFNVASKPLPFKKRLNVVNHATYQVIQKTLAKNNLRCYVIDDSQYLMAFNMFDRAKEMASLGDNITLPGYVAFNMFDRAKEMGYQKFTDCALNFYNLLALIRDHTTDDTIVYLLHHTERDDTGHIKAKTSGKMLDNQLTLEGLFSIVLLAETDGKEHWFTTQSDGFTPAKSPMEMFAAKIDNDLKAVDTAIREYYGFNEEAKKNEKAY